MAKNTVVRAMHDVGLAAWAGGSLMGAVGLNGAAEAARDPQERSRIVNEGWDRWTPVNAAAIGAFLVGSIGLTYANKGRMATQDGVMKTSALKAGMTAAAAGATAYARVLGRKISQKRPPLADGTTPGAQTPEESSSDLRKLSALQWAIPALTGSLLVMNSQMGEQQRPTSVISGLLGKTR